uniref:Uncharacterized protein n=1 Tax=Strigamia maritima TaxID=126957 RepID=T1JIF9_STRMM
MYTMPAYSATKQAVINLSVTWGNLKNVEVTHVKVNAICPDLTATTMVAGPMNGLHDEFVENFFKEFRSLPLKTSEIASGVIKLLQEGVSGAILVLTCDK